MADLDENEEAGDLNIEVVPEEPLHGPDGVMDTVFGREALAGYWLGKLGIIEADMPGVAIAWGEGCSLAFLHPLTGKWLTPEQIVKLSGRPVLVQ